VAADPQKLKARLEALRGHRSIHENTWRECFDYSLPALSAGFNSQQPLTAGEVQSQKARLLDSTASDALRTMADGFMGGLTPANSRWFAMDIGTETQEERRWLDDSADVIWENIHASNFDAEAYDAMLFLGGAGSFALYEDEDDAGGYYFENWPLSQCFFASARTGGRVDTVYREFSMSAAALMAEYGREKVSQQVRDMASRGKQDDEIKVLLAIEPRADYLPGATIATRLPFASCHIELDTLHILREGGYHEFPVICPRWYRLPGSVYALGPMSDALPDVKSLQEVKRWEFAAAETAIAPPMVAVDDGVLNPRLVKLGPRKIIVANDVDSIKPLVTGARVEFGQLIVADLQSSIRRVLMADMFQKLLDDPRMTATQVHAIVGVLRQRMGPRFGRFQSEYLQPLVERSFGLALRAGVLGQPPESLMDREYTVRFLSPLARSQKLEDVSAMDRHEGALIAEAQAVPTVLDTYDWDEAQRYRAELLGVPAKLIPDARKVARARDEKQAAMQQQAQQQVALQAQAAGAEAMATNLAGA
jgi:hypothetical protein